MDIAIAPNARLPMLQDIVALRCLVLVSLLRERSIVINKTDAYE